MWMLLFTTGTATLWLLLLVRMAKEHLALIEIVSGASQLLAPSTGLVFLAIISYEVSIYLGKKCYHLVQRVEKVLGEPDESKE